MRFNLDLSTYVQAFLSPFAGKVSDQVEPRIVASIGMVLTAVGLFFSLFRRSNNPGFIVT
jgi:hypothetical protein